MDDLLYGERSAHTGRLVAGYGGHEIVGPWGRDLHGEREALSPLCVYVDLSRYPLPLKLLHLDFQLLDTDVMREYTVVLQDDPDRLIARNSDVLRLVAEIEGTDRHRR